MSKSFEEIHTAIYRKSLHKTFTEVKGSTPSSRVKLGVANLLALGPTLLCLWLLILSIQWLLQSTIPLLTALFVVPLIYITAAPAVSMFIVKLPERKYTRVKEPETFEKLDRLGQRITNRKIDILAVSKDMNASVSLVRGKIILTLGVPLVLTLSLQEIHAVICHELGHLKRDARSPTDYFAIGYLFQAADYWISMFDESSKPSEVSSGILIPVFWFFKLVIRSYCTLVMHLVWSEKLKSEFMADRAALLAARREDLVSGLSKLEKVDVIREIVSFSRINNLDFPQYFIEHAAERATALYSEYLNRSFEEPESSTTVTDHPFVSDRILAIKDDDGYLAEIETTRSVVALIEPNFYPVLQEIQNDFDHNLGRW